MTICHLWTRMDLRGFSSAKALCAALAAGPKWLPLKHVGHWAPPGEPFGVEPAAELLVSISARTRRRVTGSLTVWGQRRRREGFLWPEVSVFIEWSRDAEHTFNTLLLSTEVERDERNPGAGEMRDWCARLFRAARADFAFVGAKAEYDAKNLIRTESETGTGQCIEGLDLEYHLPGIYWVNFFGPAYLDYFGAERLRKAPWLEVTDLGDAGLQCTTCAEPADWALREARDRQQAIRAALGEEHFFDRRAPKRPTRAPDFDFTSVRQGMPPSRGTRLTAAMEEATGDPQAFIREAPQIAEAYRQRASRPKRLDYSPESLAIVDRQIARARKQGSVWQSLGLVRQIAAYYGEVVRRTLGGTWHVDEGIVRDTAYQFHVRHVAPTPALDLGRLGIEFPLLAVMRAWYAVSRGPMGAARLQKQYADEVTTGLRVDPGRATRRGGVDLSPFEDAFYTVTLSAIPDEEWVRE